MSDRLPISEIFGPTLQGEGPFAGRNASFIRLGGCNLACSWCDTPYSWDGSRFDLREEITSLSTQEILDRLPPAPGIVVLTGGEPLLYMRQPPFVDLLQRLRSSGTSIHVETNGTLRPTEEVLELVDVFVVSPKLPNAGLATNYGASALADGWRSVAEATEVHLKFVCESREDVSDAVLRAREAGIAPSNTWVMPQATNATSLGLRWPIISQAAVDAGINATSRLHLLAWGEKRGH